MITNADQDVEKLIKQSQKAELNAYTPYSNFSVGAALKCKDGTVFTGCNVENASFGPSICAERTAMVKAISEGHREFQAIAVTAARCQDYISPCGSCRQFMAEFGLNWMVYMSKNDGTYIQKSVAELLPHAFVPKHLNDIIGSHD